MAIESLINNIKTIVDILKEEDFSILYRTEPPTQPWNGLTENEIRSLVEGTIDILNQAIDSDLLSTLTFNYLNALNNSLNQFNQQFQSIKTLQPQQLQNQHHNPLNQIQAADNQIRASGLFALVKLSPDIEKKKEIIDSQIQNANKSAAELERLTEQVRELLNPAVAGALSNAFDVRRKAVARQKWFWFLMLLVSGGVSIWLTMDITHFITEVFKNADATKENIGFVWFIRFLLLIPGYFFIAFSVSQFLRERHYEENYAHKLSIAQTLPSYSELITNEQVKDDITSSATKVVFAPPYKEKGNEHPKKGLLPEQIKDIAEAINAVRGAS